MHLLLLQNLAHAHVAVLVEVLAVVTAGNARDEGHVRRREVVRGEAPNKFVSVESKQQFVFRFNFWFGLFWFVLVCFWFGWFGSVV